MRKFAAVCAVLTIGLGALTACSGDSAYCDALKSNEDAAKASSANIKDSIDKMKEVRDKAPSEVQDDWDVLIDYLQRSEDAKGDPEQAGDLAKDADKVTTATQNISKHAKDSCKIDIPT
jgi:hypothetical protein